MHKSEKSHFVMKNESCRELFKGESHHNDIKKPFHADFPETRSILELCYINKRLAKYANYLFSVRFSPHSVMLGSWDPF